MSRAVIRLGDYTSHGGRVIEATVRMTIDGIPVALWGDHCSCPILGHDNCVICEGEVQAVFDGRPVALEGHKTSCGAALIPSQKDRCDCVPLSIRAGAAAAGPATAAVTEAEAARDATQFDRKFKLTDVENGSAHANQRYRITTSQGVFEGITDDEGTTENVLTGAFEDDLHIALLGD